MVIRCKGIVCVASFDADDVKVLYFTPTLMQHRIFGNNSLYSEVIRMKYFIY